MEDTTPTPSSSPSCFNDVPNEIAEHIYAQLEHPDIGVFRLVNKKLAECGRRQLDATLHVKVTMESFKHLFSIAHTPTLRKLVTHVHYDAVVLADTTECMYDMCMMLQDLAIQKEALEERYGPDIAAMLIRSPDFELPNARGMLAAEKDGAPWKAFQKLHETQQYILDLSLDGKFLEDAFMRFDNLQSFSINCLPEYLHPTTQSLYKPCLAVESAQLEYVQACNTALTKAGVILGTLPHFQHLQLRLRDTDLFLQLEGLSLDMVWLLCLKIKSLDLSFQSVSMKDSSEEVFYKTFAFLMSKAHWLKSLTLSLVPGSRFAKMRRLKLAKGFNGRKWEHLEEFKLAGFTIVDDFDLVEFIHNHSNCLKKITLDDVGFAVELKHGQEEKGFEDMLQLAATEKKIELVIPEAFRYEEAPSPDSA